MVSKTAEKLPRQTSRIKMRAEWVELADYLAELREVMVSHQRANCQVAYRQNKEPIAQQQPADIVLDDAPRFTRFHDECAAVKHIVGGGLLPQEENLGSLWHRVDFPFVLAIMVSLVGAIVMQVVL